MAMLRTSSIDRKVLQIHSLNDRMGFMFCLNFYLIVADYFAFILHHLSLFSPLCNFTVSTFDFKVAALFSTVLTINSLKKRKLEQKLDCLIYRVTTRFLDIKQKLSSVCAQLPVHKNPINIFWSVLWTV